MSDFIKSLELSTRTERVLTDMGIDTLEKLMSLTEAQVRRWYGAGRLTWQEIRETQERVSPKLQSARSEAAAFEHFKEHVRVLNGIMRDHPHFFATPVQRGFLVAMRSDRKDERGH